MYEEFYGLRARPFKMTPDPDMLYWTDTHSLAFTMLRLSVMSRVPLAVVTGDIGSGKTTLLHLFLKELPKEHTVGLISNMQAGRGELMHWVLTAFGERISEGEPYVTTFRRFQDLVVERYAAGGSVLLIVDEAQNLDVQALEELRMLSNINAQADELLQILLIGQPQLRDLLRRPELTQFSQRIGADFHLTALPQEEVAGYVQHRLEHVGAAWRIFPAATCALVAKTTRGVPRLINVLCDLCLMYGYAAGQKVIDVDLLREFLVSAHDRGLYEQFTPLEETSPRLRQA